MCRVQSIGRRRTSLSRPTMRGRGPQIPDAHTATATATPATTLEKHPPTNSPLCSPRALFATAALFIVLAATCVALSSQVLASAPQKCPCSSSSEGSDSLRLGSADPAAAIENLTRMVLKLTTRVGVLEGAAGAGSPTPPKSPSVGLPSTLPGEPKPSPAADTLPNPPPRTNSQVNRIPSAHAPTRTHERTHARTHARTCLAHTNTQTRTRAHERKHARTPARTPARPPARAYATTHTHARAHTRNHAGTHVRTHTHTYTNTLTHTRARARTHAHSRSDTCSLVLRGRRFRR